MTKEDLKFASSKLTLIQNPVRTNSSESESHHEKPEAHGHGHGHEEEPFDPSIVQFTKREAASTSELFYDLWFVANLTVYATVHPITHYDSLVSFIGYFLLLWNTWFQTTVFDARFGHDGIVNRISRGLHLGVMLGMAILGAAFDTDKLRQSVIQIASFFFMGSRFLLAFQYSTVLYHTYHHKRARIAMASSVVLTIVPALIYMAVGIVAFNVERHRSVTAWYVVGLFELISVVGHATVSKTLSVDGTHFNERLNLLTLIVIGEGVIILTKNIAKLVQYTYIKEIALYWSPALSGIVFCGGLTLYLVFQLYFDSMHHHNHLHPIFQAGWTLAHLPFHATLVLLAEGGSQLAIWWRAMEALSEGRDKIWDAAINAGATTANSTQVGQAVYDTAEKIMQKYGVAFDYYTSSIVTMEDAANQIASIPESYWTRTNVTEEDPDYQTFVSGLMDASVGAGEAVLQAFGLPPADKKSSDGSEDSWDTAKYQMIKDTDQRQGLVYTYLYSAAGIVLVLLAVMHVISKRKGWSVFNMARTSFTFVVGIILSLVAIIRVNPDAATAFVGSAWQMPIITIAYFLVLLVAHLPHPKRVFFTRSEVTDVENNEAHNGHATNGH